MALLGLAWRGGTGHGRAGNSISIFYYKFFYSLDCLYSALITSICYCNLATCSLIYIMPRYLSVFPIGYMCKYFPVFPYFLYKLIYRLLYIIFAAPVFFSTCPIPVSLPITYVHIFFTYSLHISLFS